MEGVRWPRPCRRVRQPIRPRVPGCEDLEGCWNVIAQPDAQGPNGLDFGHVSFGSSFILATTFDDHGPVADAILTYSQSANPRSLHYADQTRLFSQKKWVRLAFTPPQIRDQAVTTTVLRCQ